MAKILAFAGSPRKDGHTNTLMKTLLDAAGGKGAEIEVFDLNAADVRGCQGCFYCRQHPGCVVDDSLAPVYAEIRDATALVIASPIYFADVAGQCKIWVDRMFPMVEGNTFTPRHPGKKVITIFSQGSEDAGMFDEGIRKLHGFITTFGWRLQESFLIAGTSTPGYRVPAELIERAKAAGEGLV